jgi:hypothetical protein
MMIRFWMAADGMVVALLFLFPEGLTAAMLFDWELMRLPQTPFLRQKISCRFDKKRMNWRNWRRRWVDPTCRSNRIPTHLCPNTIAKARDYDGGSSDRTEKQQKT